MSSAALEIESEQWIENRKHAAYTSWLIGAGKGKSFNKLCEELGLSESVVLTVEEKGLKRARVMQTAAEIIDADKRQLLNGKVNI